MRIRLTVLLASLITAPVLAQHAMPPGMSHEEHLKQLAHELWPINTSYQEDNDFLIWGIVTHVIKKMS